MSFVLAKLFLAPERRGERPGVQHVDDVSQVREPYRSGADL